MEGDSYEDMMEIFIFPIAIDGIFIYKAFPNLIQGGGKRYGAIRMTDILKNF